MLNKASCSSSVVVTADMDDASIASCALFLLCVCHFLGFSFFLCCLGFLCEVGDGYIYNGEGEGRERDEGALDWKSKMSL